MQRHWIDPITSLSRQMLLEHLRGCPKERNDYVLLDRAFTDDREWSRFAEHVQGISLYAGTYAGEGVEDISPWLLKVPGTDQLEAWLARVFALCEGRPMLGGMRTQASLDEMPALLRRRLEASVDGRSYVLRLGDTRCLPSLYERFDMPQRAVLTHGLEGWWYIDRAGQLVQLMMVAGHEGENDKGLELSIEQHEKLGADALADTVIAYIRQRSEVFGALDGPPSRIHQAVEQVLMENEPGQQLTAATYRGVLEELGRLQFLEGPDDEATLGRG